MKNLSVDSMFSPHCRFRKVYLLLLFSAGRGLLVVKTFYLSAVLCEITSKVIFFICGPSSTLRALYHRESDLENIPPSVSGCSSSILPPTPLRLFG